MMQDFEDRKDLKAVDSLFFRGVAFALCAALALWPLAPWIEKIGAWLDKFAVVR